MYIYIYIYRYIDMDVGQECLVWTNVGYVWNVHTEQTARSEGEFTRFPTVLLFKGFDAPLE